MKLKEKFDSIDQSKLNADQKDFLSKIEKATKNFTSDNKEVNDKVEGALDKMIATFKEKMPEAIKTKAEKKEPKTSAKKTTAKPSQTSNPKRTVMSVAKEIRKDGESWADAQKRARAEMKKDKESATKEVKTEMDKLLAFINTRKELEGISGTDLGRDSSRSAKRRGARVVTHSGSTSNQYGTYENKLGRKYWESRDRHSDRLAPNYPKDAPMLENGGGVNNKFYDIFASKKNGFDLYEINGNEDFFVGNYESTEEAKEVAEKLGLQKRPMYMRYAKGGMLSPKERYNLEIKGLTGVSVGAIEKYIDENNLNDNDVLNIVVGLGRKQLKGADVSTAMVGKKGNAESKKLIEFVKDNKAMKLELGGNLKPEEKLELRILKSIQGFNQGNSLGGIMEVLGYSNLRFNKNATEKENKEVADSLKSLVKKGYVEGDVDGKISYSENFKITKKGSEYLRKFSYGSYELGGTIVTDLAGHTGGSLGGDPTLLSGVSGTSYSGLVGETGAMSSGEMFENGGGVDNNDYTYRDFYRGQGGIKFKTEEEAKEFIKRGKPFVRKQLREGNMALVYNGKDYFIGEKVKYNDEEYQNGGSVGGYDLAGNLGGNFNVGQNDGALSGVSGTSYSGLVGETGAMSSGELFENGGGIQQSFVVVDSFGNPAQHYDNGGYLTDPTFGQFQAGVYAEGGSLENHGIKEGDTFVKTIAGGIQKVKDKDGKIVFINLATGERDSQPPLPFDDGGEVTYFVNKDGIKVRSVAKPDKELSEKEWMEKHSESKEARAYADGGELNAFSMRMVKGTNSKPDEVLTENQEVKFAKGGSLREKRNDYLSKLGDKEADVWDKIGANSGTKIRGDKKMLKEYAEGVEEMLIEENVQGRSFDQEDYDFYTDQNWHLFNDFLVWNGYYKPEMTVVEKKWREKAFKEGNIYVSDPEVIFVKRLSSYDKKGYVQVVKTASRKYVVELKTNAGDWKQFNDTWNLDELEKAEKFAKRIAENNKVKYEGVDTTPYEAIHGKSKNYIVHADIESITVKKDGKEIKVKGSDVLNGANVLKKGGELSESATYYPKRSIVSVKLKNGKDINPANGYWVLKTPKMSRTQFEEESFEYKKGGKVSFAEKSKAIAKNFEGKRVEPEYQKEYGKTYDAKEAKEVGDKIAGAQKAKYDAKAEKGAVVKRKSNNPKAGSAMVLAKEIRKDGEKWNDALKRAYEMMKNK